MKFVISRLELNDLLNKVQGVVSQRSTIPILSNVLLEAANDELVLTATDLTVSIRCYTDTKVLEEGATTLPVKRFAQLVRELTAVNLEISTHNEITEVVAESSRFKLNGMSKAEFPAMPDLSGSVSFTMSQAKLKDMFFRTAFAVSREDNRYVLTGVLMQLSNSVATFVGTDGKRLSRAHAEVEISPDFTGAYTIPLKAVEEILRNLQDDESEKATVHLLSDRIAVDANNVTIVTKLLQGDYPDYNRVIPESTESLVSLHREELITLLRQISLFTADAAHSVRFTLSDGELRVSANTMEIGEGKVSMPANYNGPNLEIAFNPNSFADILRHCKHEAITLGVTDQYNPGIITDQNGNGEKVQQPSPLFVLMPMRLNEV